MAYLSEEAVASYVMQHSITRALVAKTDVNEVYRIVIILSRNCIYHEYI